MKKILSVILIVSMLAYTGKAKAQLDQVCETAVRGAELGCLGLTEPASVIACFSAIEVALNTAPQHEPFFHFLTFDIGGAISRAVTAVIKGFLGDDKKIVADLVYNKGSDGASKGGMGGLYTGNNGSANGGLAVNAVASSITDIPVEAGAYPSDIKVQEVSIAKLADLRIQEIMKENAALDTLSKDKWAILYRAQQRSIQAMTDALVMKKAYKELASVAAGASGGSFEDYSAALSTIATRRLLLDAILALRKRVIAARIRARAETMEMDIETVSTAPILTGEGTTNPSTEETPSNSSVTEGENPSSGSGDPSTEENRADPSGTEGEDPSSASDNPSTGENQTEPSGTEEENSSSGANNPSTGEDQTDPAGTEGEKPSSESDNPSGENQEDPAGAEGENPSSGSDNPSTAGDQTEPDASAEPNKTTEDDTQKEQAEGENKKTTSPETEKSVTKEGEESK